MYAHVSRLLGRTGQQAIYLTGPGHGGPALVAAAWLEGTYSEIYPDVSQDRAGVQRLFRQFSLQGGSLATSRSRRRAQSTKGRAGICAGARIWIGV